MGFLKVSGSVRFYAGDSELPLKFYIYEHYASKVAIFEKYFTL